MSLVINERMVTTLLPTFTTVCTFKLMIVDHVVELALMMPRLKFSIGGLKRGVLTTLT